MADTSDLPIWLIVVLAVIISVFLIGVAYLFYRRHNGDKPLPSQTIRYEQGSLLYDLERSSATVLPKYNPTKQPENLTLIQVIETQRPPTFKPQTPYTHNDLSSSSLIRQHEFSPNTLLGKSASLKNKTGKGSVNRGTPHIDLNRDSSFTKGSLMDKNNENASIVQGVSRSASQRYMDGVSRKASQRTAPLSTHESQWYPETTNVSMEDGGIYWEGVSRKQNQRVANEALFEKQTQPLNDVYRNKSQASRLTKKRSNVSMNKENENNSDSALVDNEAFMLPRRKSGHRVEKKHDSVKRQKSKQKASNTTTEPAVSRSMSSRSKKSIIKSTVRSLEEDSDSLSFDDTPVIYSVKEDDMPLGLYRRT